MLGYVYDRMGVARRYIFGLLVLSLLGSYVNIPVAELQTPQLVPPQVVSLFAIHYVIPVTVELSRTIIAVNLGGAVIPTLLSVSIGGAGTFDGIFLTGILAVVLASGFAGRRR